ncbi:MAG: glycosyltransferase [Bacteroidota bacterium]
MVKNNNYIVGIYTEGFPHNGPNYDYNLEKDITGITQKYFFEQYIKPYKALVVGSKNLQKQYAPFDIPTYFCNAIYRESDFCVSNDSKFFNECLVIGWTGNPTREFKGFDTIIKPAIEKVKNTGRNVVLKTQFSGTYDDLINFYEDVALCLIASHADTGPSLFVECSLSGIPCISTKVGFPDMVIENGKNGFIVERQIDAFFEKICFCYDNRDALYVFSKRIKKDYLSILGNDILINNWRKVIEETTSNQ